MKNFDRVIGVLADFVEKIAVIVLMTSNEFVRERECLLWKVVFDKSFLEEQLGRKFFIVEC